MCKKCPVGVGGLLGRVLVPFWSENGFRLCSFWPGIRYGFQGNYPECMNVFIVSIQNEQGRKRNKQIGNGFEEFCCLRSNLSNDDKRPGLKTGIQNDIFWSETASGFGNRAGHPHREFPGIPPGSCNQFGILLSSLKVKDQRFKWWRHKSSKHPGLARLA